MSEFVLQFAARFPTVFILENLHWADGETIALLAQLARKIRIRSRTAEAGALPDEAPPPLPPRLMILCTYRDSELEGQPMEGLRVQLLESKEAAERILPELTFRDTCRLVRSMLGLDHDPEAFVRKIDASSKGNPLFIEEAMIALLEENQIVYRDGRWHTAVDLDSLPVPATAGEAFRKRVAKLAPDLITLVKGLAVFDRATPVGLLSELVGETPEVLSSRLAQLSRKGIVARRILEEDLLFELKHPFIRETVYEGIRSEERARLHRTVGEVLEKHWGKTADTHAPELADHYLRARCEDGVNRFGLKGVRNLFGAVSLRENFILGRDLLAFGGFPASERAELCANMGNVCILLGKAEEGIRISREGIALAREHGQQQWEMKCTGMLGTLHLLRNEYDTALPLFREAAALAEAMEDPASLTNWIGHMGTLHYFRGEVDTALEHWQRAIDITEAKGELTSMVLWANNIATVHTQANRFTEALNHAKRAAKIAREANHRPYLGMAYASIGLAYSGMFKNDTALDYLTKALKIAEEIGHKRAVAQRLQNIAMVHEQSGAVDRALLDSRRAITYAEEIGDTRMISGLMGDTGYFLFLQGRLEEAKTHYLKALALAESVNAMQFVGYYLGSIGMVWKEQGDFEKSFDHLRKAIRVAKEVGDGKFKAFWTGQIGQNHLERGEFDVAEGKFREAYEGAKTLNDQRAVWKVTSMIGNLHRRRGNFDEALEHFERSRNLAREIRDVAGERGLTGSIGTILCIRGDLEKAEAHLRYAIEGSGSTVEKASRILDLATLYGKAGNLKEQEPLLEESARLDKECQVPWLHGKNLVTTARALAGKAKGGEVLEHLREAEAIYSRMGMPLERAEALIEAAEIHRRTGAVEEARRAAKEALELTESIGAEYLRIGAVITLAAAELETPSPDLEAMLGQLQEVLETAERIRVPEERWRILHCLGRVYERKGDLISAGVSLRTAAEQIREIWSNLPEKYREMYLEDEERSALRDTYLRVEKACKKESPMMKTPSLDRDDKTKKMVAELIKIAGKLNSEHDLDRLLEQIIDGVMAIFQAQRGFVLLKKRGEVQPFVSRTSAGEGEETFDLAFSRSIAEKVMAGGEGIVTGDAAQDRRYRSFQSVADLSLKSVICMPVKSEGEIQGAVYLDNPRLEKAFSEDDKILLGAFCDLAGVALQNAKLYAALKKENIALKTEFDTVTIELKKVRNALDRTNLEIGLRHDFGSIIWQSEPMRKALALVDKVVEADLPVLIEGETGTGKELVARAIHDNSRRAKKPFVALNCGGVAETLLESELFGHVKGAFTGADRDKPGLFELAEGGTLFLDEISEMSSRMQTSLLRVLQEYEIKRIGGSQAIQVDVRVICASNQNLKSLVETGTFREDLFYRLNAITVPLPPLRQREEDVPLLADFFLKAACEKSGKPGLEIPRPVLKALLAYDWPGNVRELKNEVYRLAALATDSIEVDDLSETLRKIAPPTRRGLFLLEDQVSLKELERRYIERLLELQGGNKSQVARILGISRSTLRRKLEDTP
ncbi:MAG: sigma 54-interacting transcriptional regulator [Planctomycetota bacterium]